MPPTTPPRYTSRKFLAVAISTATVVLAALTGEVAWPEATREVLALVVAYLTAEGAADVAGRWRTFPSPDAATAADAREAGG